MQASISEKLISAIGAVVLVGLFGYVLLIGLTIETNGSVERTMSVMSIEMPRVRRPPKPHARQPKPRKATGPASPHNFKNRAAEIVAPPQQVVLPIASPVVVAVKAGSGMASSTGASDQPGPGDGAGGEGTGGGGGDCDDDGDCGTPPRQIRGHLKFSDLPADLRDGEIGGTVSVRYGVAADGMVSDCDIMVSSGSAELDQLTCRLIQLRFRFHPARDGDGRPVSSIIEEKHSWEFDENPDRRSRP